jgi:exonuclease I
MYANEMNQYPKISKRMLYDYYHFGIQPKKKRFAKWAKPNKDADTMLVSEYFKCNIRVAEQYLALLSPGDLDSIKSKMFKGGRG